MNETERKRAFIIRFVYYAIWAVVVYFILRYAMPLFMPFVVAFILAFFLKPVINFASKKLHMSRKGAAVVVLTFFYLAIGSLLTLGTIKLVVSVRGWLTDLPAYYTSTIEPALANMGAWLDGFFDRLDPAIGDFIGNIGDSLTSALSGLVTSLSSGAVSMATSVGWVVMAAFLMIIASYFFVVDYYKVTSFITKQLPEGARRKLFVVKDYTVNVLLKFGSAYFILMTVTFIEVAIGLLILRAESPFMMALITAMVDILPVFGTGTIMIPWAVYSLIMGDYFFGVGLAIVYAIITVVRQILEPKVVGKQIGLYPLLTLVCMFIGVQLFGFWGLFVLPITVTIIIHLNREGEIKLFKE